MNKPILYLGERVDFLGHIIQKFRDESGEVHHFSGIKGIYFGNVYLMKDDKLKSRFPESIDPPPMNPTEKERREFEAQKLIVTNSRLEKRKAMNIKRPHEDIVRAVNLLRPFYQQLSNYDRISFMGWVSNEASKKKRNK